MDKAQIMDVTTEGAIPARYDPKNPFSSS
jgi:hypothetical protein